MPVASIKFNTGCILTEKRPDVNYSEVKDEINQIFELSNSGGIIGTSKEDFRSFINALPNRMEVERTKHLFSSTHTMSARQGAEFGIHRMKKRAEKIQSATEEINRIKSKYMYLAKLEKKVFLHSVGHVVTDYLSSEESSDSDEREDDLDENSVDDTSYKQPHFETNQNKSEHSLNDDKQRSQYPPKLTCGENNEAVDVENMKQNRPIIDINSAGIDIVLDILRRL